MNHPIRLATFALAATLVGKGETVSILLKSGETVEGTLASKSVSFAGRAIPVRNILSIHVGGEASPRESERIAADLAAAAGTDRKQRDAAIAEIVDIGIPALSPLLRTYKDVTATEPNHYYRLFSRIVSGTQDSLDRAASLLRTADGQSTRGEFGAADLTVKTSAGSKTVAAADVRRLAVMRAVVDRDVDVHALHHCQQIEFLDTGVAVTPQTALTSSARGFVRLSWNDDSWTSDPDGLKKPGGKYKSNLFEGHPFGALVARVGVGETWVAGTKSSKTGLAAGRLYYAIQDNRHWQNNLGSFRLTLRATNAYDLGDPR